MFNFSKKASPEELFTELKDKGWFELTPPEVLSEAEANLKDRVSRKYVDTTVPYEESPFLQEKLSLGKEYWLVSLDSRVFSGDAETLIEENGIVDLLKKVNALMLLNSQHLLTECSNSINQNGFNLAVSVDGTVYKIYGEENEKDFNWGYGVNGVVTILDSLLQKIGDKNRTYFSWGGDNDVRFYLLTDELFSYLTDKKIDGGLGPILKKI